MPPNQDAQKEHIKRANYQAVGPPGIWRSARLTTSLMTCIGIACVMTSRVNMSVAMTAMTNSSYSTNRDVTDNMSLAEICPARGDENGTESGVKEGEFPWDTHTQELILAAFFYSFCALQIPIGILVDAVPRACPWVIGLGYGLSFVCTLLVPVAARSGSVAALLAVRIIAGFAESGSYPSIYSLMSRWAPPAERSTLLAIVYMGPSIGQVIAPPISGLLSDSDVLGGWPSTFYLFGTLGLVWFVFWIILVYDSPLSHPRISEKEREYIATKLNLRKKKRKDYPWSHILTSMPLYAVALAEFAILWIFYVIQTNLPIFIKEVLRFDLSDVGLLSAVPQITVLVFTLCGGILADFLLSRNRFSLTAIRKFMSTIGIIPSSVCIVIAGYAGCNAPAIITCISLALGFSGLAYSGAGLSMMEFAPPYAGIVVAIANTFATVAGFAGPLVLSVFTENQADMRGWRHFFWLTFAITIIPLAIFLIFGTSEVQEWAKHVEDKDDIDDEIADSTTGVTKKEDKIENGIMNNG